jgi:membrane-associated protease RseP (regulator of RpoE activity)
MTELNADASATRVEWRKNVLLFLATVASVFVTGAFGSEGGWGERLVKGAEFAGTLLTILVAHELGHYVAARLHKVDASLPFFIPLPLLSPFGTMGAVIRMRGVIPTRRALLDIGASGPLAGLVFAIPLYVWGIAHSQVIEVAPAGSFQLGSSLALTLLDKTFGPTISGTQDIMLSPVAFGAWGGMFVTMINLLPVGQLDGGHVAYALFGPKQDRYARVVHRSMLAFFLVAVLGHVMRDVRVGLGLYWLGKHIANSIFWLVWFQILAILGLLAARGRGDEPKAGDLSVRTRVIATAGLVAISSFARDHRSLLLPLVFFGGLGFLVAMEVRGGTLKRHDLLDHPPTGDAPLDKVRAGIAVLTLVIFVLLFMPEPFTI